MKQDVDQHDGAEDERLVGRREGILLTIQKTLVLMKATNDGNEDASEKTKRRQDGCMCDDEVSLVEEAPSLDGMPLTKRGNVMFEAAKALAKGKTNGQNLMHSCPR